MNRLADSHSPYLLQHRDNPVDWYPWGDEAFERARREDRPIFLSIGYAACHWCHVMAHESFEDADVARLLNASFVSIKVDREERPDVDGLYMTVCQLMTGGGGWPLTVLMTPDRRPFFAGTFFPRETRGGRIGMLDLVPRVAAAWKERRGALDEQADEITDVLRGAAAAEVPGPPLGEDVLHAAYDGLRGRFDDVHGGFGEAPKFPTPHHLLFLLRHAHATGADDAVAMVRRTLDAMRRGGVYDQVGGGLHRYSTDARWLLPHFEKMLYDQALFVLALVEAWEATGDERFADTARDVLEYVRRDLGAPGGAFFAAEDADADGREGTFYVWTRAELDAVLGPDDGAWAADVFGATEAGNFEEEATRRRTGENVLHLAEPPEATAARTGTPPAAFAARLADVRARLFEHREGRVRPALDDKVLTDWNGLAVAAFARAGRAFGDDALTHAARAAARFVQSELRADDGRLLHRWRRGHAGVPATIEDVAFLAWGLVELYAATFDAAHLAEALALVDEAVAHYADDASGGFFFTAEDAESLLVRRRTFDDGALPSGNAAMLLVLRRLARLTGRTEFDERADALTGVVAGQVREYPSAFTGLLLGVQAGTARPREIVVVGDPAADDTRRMLDALGARRAPHDVVLLRSDEEDDPLDDLAPFVRAHRTLDGRATAYVCEDFACRAPTTSVDEMLRSLGAASSP